MFFYKTYYLNVEKMCILLSQMGRYLRKKWIINKKNIQYLI